MSVRTPTRDAAGAESRIDSRWVDNALGADRQPRPRPPVKRARGLLLLGLLGAVALVLWLRMLAHEPHLAVTWRALPDGSVTLASSGDPGLQSMVGRRLRSIQADNGERIEATPALVTRAPRWVVDDEAREAQLALRQGTSSLLLQPHLTLYFDQPPEGHTSPQRRGLGGLGPWCWVMCAMALALYLAVVVVTLAKPGPVSALFAAMGLGQALNLLLIGAELMPGLGFPAALVAWDMPLRLSIDGLTLAALLHLAVIHPHRLWQSPAVPGLVWALSLLALGTALLWPPAGLWWWAQGWMVVCGLLATLALGRARKQQGSPMAAMLQRLAGAGTGTLLLLSLAVAVTTQDNPADSAQRLVALVGSVIWSVFFTMLLLLAPFLSRSRQVLRELAILAGISTVASSLVLLFEAIFPLGPVASLALALLISLAMYLALRGWMMRQLTGSADLSAERMFDSLYRVARELEQAPEQSSRLISGLLREVFDPLEVARTDQTVSRIRVADDGSTLVVPIPRMPGPGVPTGSPGAIVLRFARRGRRLFTVDDIQLSERLIEQLRRAVAYDRAVEHGRTEERTRIAQDLHDDIGARLLTLMYKAPNPEIEEYIRHTLQDLKTLTRGLAAANHRLSHAAAEWKADIAQRLGAAGCDLRWDFSADRDLMLSVVQWSGLTRVLRELVNNILSHARASQVDISAHFDRGRLTLVVSDDGIGSAPAQWSHGLGLGGVRKRVKLLGGQVSWTEREAGGIRCEVRVLLVTDAG